MGMPVMSYHACVFVPVCSPVPYKIYAYCNTTVGCGFCLYNSPKAGPVMMNSKSCCQQLVTHVQLLFP